MSVSLKVCGLTRRVDLEACVELGVDALGLNFWPKSKRALDLSEAQEMLVGFDRGASQLVGVFVEATPQVVQKAVEGCSLDAVQLHGDQSWADYSDVGCPLVQVVRGTPGLDRKDNGVGPLA